MACPYRTLETALFHHRWSGYRSYSSLGNKNVDALTEIHDRLDELTNAVKTFATAQDKITKAIYLLAPLNPALMTLLADVEVIISKLPNLPDTTIPSTLSTKVSLD